ncbi:hypothetical protein OQZ33_10875 [Pedobacter sp. MC2016-05]|nr:hypothetical protein [Pedobacter sp. MC2016-05]
MAKSESVVELQTHLADVESLCQEYDLGNKLVVSQIAKRVLILFHNAEQSKSLLTQLKLNHIQLNCSSETYQSKSVNNFIGLLKLEHRKGAGWDYLPKLEQSSLIKVSLENWWSNKKILVDSSSIAFTRAKIIKALAGNDQIMIDTSGWKLTDANGNKNTINLIPGTVRQIAYEVIETFKNMDINRESKLHHKS